MVGIHNLVIPKFTIHILAITAIESDTFDLLPERNAIIVCGRRISKYVYKCKNENILILDFADVEDKNCLGAFNTAHARKIISFVRNVSDEVTDLYICCSKGGSRSPAVAAALLRMSGRSDKDVWRNPYYVPNTLVYYRLCKEYGLVFSAVFVRLRKYINNLSFRRVQKGKPCRYERWQILE